MKRELLSLALLMCISSGALAGQIPEPGGEDARMRTVIYDPGQVVRLSTAVGRAIVISFSSDEKITTVAVSNSRDLIANPRDSFLFMKPKTTLPPQPIIVLTSGPRGVRRYVFEVEATPAVASPADTPEIFYSVEFVYPGDREAARKAAERERRAREEQRAITRELARSNTHEKAVPQDPPKDFKNWRYVGRGNKALLPIEVYDDGYSTVFRFPGNTRIPAIFRLNPDGKEATVDYSIKGDSVIVGAVAPGWRLRDGNTVLCVWNRAYDKIGRSPGTNTTSPKVNRITRDAPR